MWIFPDAVGKFRSANCAAGSTGPEATSSALLECVERDALALWWHGGLRPANLFEGRDLKPTLDLEALIAYACAEAFQLEPEVTARVLFPAFKRGKPLSRLLRA